MSDPAMRGFFAIGAEGISKPMNLGNLVRSAHAFGASFVFLVNADYAVRAARSDTSQAEFQLPVYDFAVGRGAAAAARLPAGRLRAGRRRRRAAELPPSAATPPTCSGPERSSLSPAMLARCHHVVRIPTRFCINLAVAGAVVMYDRLLSPRPVRAAAAACRRARPSRCRPHVHGPIRRFRRATTWPARKEP